MMRAGGAVLERDHIFCNGRGYSKYGRDYAEPSKKISGYVPLSVYYSLHTSRQMVQENIKAANVGIACSRLVDFCLFDLNSTDALFN